MTSYGKRALISVGLGGLRTMEHSACGKSLSMYELGLLFKWACICAVILLIPGLGSKRGFNLAWMFYEGALDWMSL